MSDYVFYSYVFLTYTLGFCVAYYSSLLLFTINDFKDSAESTAKQNYQVARFFASLLCPAFLPILAVIVFFWTLVYILDYIPTIFNKKLRAEREIERCKKIIKEYEEKASGA